MNRLPVLDGTLGATPLLHRLLLLFAPLLLAASWLYSLRNCRAGMPRLLVALPVVALNWAAPLIFRRVGPRYVQTGEGDPEAELVTVVLLQFMLTWLCSFKVLAWAGNRGPLSRSWNPLQFAAIMLAPITPVEDTETAASRATKRNGRQSEHAGSAANMLLAFLAKVGIIVGVLLVLQANPPALATEFCYALGLYAVLGYVMDGPAAVASALIGIQVSPHFDRPWLATSIQDWWSNRWDIAAGNTLRHLIYEPILEGRLVHPEPSQQQQQHAKQAQQAAHGGSASHRARRRLLALVACFVVSGIMHEVQFVYMTGQTSQGLMMIFFLAQVPLLVAERLAGNALRRRGVKVPTLLCTLTTISTLLLIGHCTFWAATDRYGVTDTAVVSLTNQLDAAKAWLAAASRDALKPGLAAA